MNIKSMSLDTIYLGDCIEILEGLPDASVDLIFADPPYYLQLSRELFRPNLTKVHAVDDDWDKFTNFKDYDDFTSKWLEACRRVLKDTGTLWVIGSYHNIYRVGAILQDLGYWILNDVIWIKDNPMPNFRGVRFTNAHETLIWAQKKKGSRYTFNHRAMKTLNGDLQMRSDWHLPLCTGMERIRENGEKVHTTQKPEGLLYRILVASSNPGDVILDPFFGTGTTGAVAKKLGRHYIGIEKNPDYVRVARERIAAVTPIESNALVSSEKRGTPRIPFGALLEAGLLQPGQTLTFAKDSTISATIQVNGQIQSGTLRGSIHSLAKSLLEGAPANGWEMWLFVENGKYIPINVLRQRILSQGNDR